MNLPMIVSMNARRWSGLVLGALVVAMMHLNPATNAGLGNEPWPALLGTEPSGFDPAVALLQQRANGSMDKLVQSGVAQQPL